MNKFWTAAWAVSNRRAWAIDLKRGVPIALVLPLQISSVEPAKLDTPETNRFATDGNTSFGQEIFNMAVAQIEPIVEPDGVGDAIWR